MWFVILFSFFVAIAYASTCINVLDCPDAAKYIQHRKYENRTVDILRSAHCGGYTQMVYCDTIPKFEFRCTFLNDCAEAKKHILYRKFYPYTKNMLRLTHCGTGDRGYGSEPKIFCEQIPKFFDECTFLKDCAEAQKYISRRKFDPETKRVLRENHCDLVDRGGELEPKVYCKQIPKFDDNCVLLENCPEALELIQFYRFYSKTLSTLEAASCGYIDQREMVWCNKIRSLVDIRGFPTVLSLIGCEGTTVTSRISNGIPSSLEEFPWLALLKYKSTAKDVSYRCHGNLITSKYVLTAAHCLRSNPVKGNECGKVISVILGEYDTRNTTDCVLNDNTVDCSDPIQEISVQSCLVHPKFSIYDITHDIAIIKLDKNAKLSRFVQPVCLPLLHSHVIKDQPLWIAGWGNTNKNVPSPIKLKAKIFLLSVQECMNRVSLKLDNFQICAGSDNQTDTCKGDSGGPLVLVEKHQNIHKSVLVGIVSFGFQCGGRVAIYTNVSAFTGWISNGINLLEH